MHDMNEAPDLSQFKLRRGFPANSPCNLVTMTEGYGPFSINLLRFVVNLLVRGTLAGVVIYSCWISIENYNYWFTWHVILCTFGYVPLMAEAMMLFAGDELWTKQLTRTQKHWTHAILITIGTLIITAGTLDFVFFATPDDHFTTLHGITGLISNILILISIAFGLMAHYAQDMRKCARPVVLKFLHNSVGILGYVIGIASLCYAFYTHWFIYYTSESSRVVALVATILGTAWTMNTAFVSGFHQIRALCS